MMFIQMSFLHWIWPENRKAARKNVVRKVFLYPLWYQGRSCREGYQTPLHLTGLFLSYLAIPNKRMFQEHFGALVDENQTRHFFTCCFALSLADSLAELSSLLALAGRSMHLPPVQGWCHSRFASLLQPCRLSHSPASLQCSFYSSKVHCWAGAPKSSWEQRAENAACCHLAVSWRFSQKKLFPFSLDVERTQDVQNLMQGKKFGICTPFTLEAS